MQLNKRYLLKSVVAESMAVVKEIVFKLDINTQEETKGCTTLQMNDIAFIKIHTAKPMVFDSYSDNRTTGSFIMIDLDSNETVGAGMVFL